MVAGVGTRAECKMLWCCVCVLLFGMLLMFWSGVKRSCFFSCRVLAKWWLTAAARRTGFDVFFAACC